MKKVKFLLTTSLSVLSFFSLLTSYNRQTKADIGGSDFYYRWATWLPDWTNGDIQVRLPDASLSMESIGFEDYSNGDGGLATELTAWAELGNGSGGYDNTWPILPESSSPYALTERAKISFTQPGETAPTETPYLVRKYMPVDGSGNPVNNVKAIYLSNSAKVVSFTATDDVSCTEALPPTFFSDSDLTTYAPGTDFMFPNSYSKPIPDTDPTYINPIFSPSGFSLGDQRTEIGCTYVVYNVEFVDAAYNSAIISEISWAGSPKSVADEWMELYNPTSSSIDLTNYIFENLGDSTTPNVTLDSAICSNLTIPAGGYFLISNYQKGNAGTMLDITADCVTTGVNLDNTGEQIVMKNSSGTVIDYAGMTGQAWFAGTIGDPTSVPPKSCAGPDNNLVKCKTMVRNSSAADGTVSSSWHSAKVELNLQHNIPVAGYNSFIRGLKGTPGLPEISGFEAEHMFTKGSEVTDAMASGGKSVLVRTIDNCSSSCFVSYGPGSELETVGNWYRVDYRLKVLDRSVSGRAVHIAISGDSGTLGISYLDAQSFAASNTYQTFSLYFKKKTSGQIDYSVWSYKTTDVYVDSITVTDLGSSEPSTKVFEAEQNLKQTGSYVLDASASGGVSVQSNSLSCWGCMLSWSVDSTAYSAGTNYSANFYLRAQSNATHTKIARLEVYDRTTATFIGLKDIYADAFTGTTAYQAFTINFTAPGIEGHKLDYRIKYYAAPYVSYDRVEIVK